MHRLIGTCGFVAVGLFFASLSPAANILVNGSFEGSAAVDGGTGDLIPSGWWIGPPSPANLSSCNVDTSTSPFTPPDGTHYIRFHSTADGSGQGKDCLWQDLTTVAGQKYTVSFSVAITGAVSGNTGLDPVWDENTGNASSMGTNQFYYAPTNSGPVSYQNFSFTETASGTTTRLDFHSVAPGGQVLLDNVSVTAVPEPGSFAVLAAGSLIAGVGRRPRRVGIR